MVVAFVISVAAQITEVVGVFLVLGEDLLVAAVQHTQVDTDGANRIVSSQTASICTPRIVPRHGIWPYAAG
jgi:hypothetical protein